mmetsp:Transcript_28220/g.25021  ORF Transcript_28220/g.25021 Transcript_28220/m.25021 type:complete len:139 (+) Transcript_28220:173-589(+)
MKEEQLEMTDVAFVMLRKAEQARYLEEKFKVSRVDHFRNKFASKKTIEIRRAPEPSDILWENVGQNHYKKECRRLTVGFASLMITVFSIFAISYLEYLQGNMDFKTYGPVLGFLSSKLIVLFVTVFEPLACMLYEYFA